MFALFFFQAEDGIRDYKVTGVQTCALPISLGGAGGGESGGSLRRGGARAAPQRLLEPRGVAGRDIERADRIRDDDPFAAVAALQSFDELVPDHGRPPEIAGAERDLELDRRV